MVRLGVTKTDPPEHVAVKIIDKNNIDVKVESLKTEVTILMDLSHPPTPRDRPPPQPQVACPLPRNCPFT